jgi:hypothetical protein
MKMLLKVWFWLMMLILLILFYLKIVKW